MSRRGYTGPAADALEAERIGRQVGTDHESRWRAHPRTLLEAEP
jgi:hypothetical protein